MDKASPTACNIMPPSPARKVILPTFTLTRRCQENGSGAICVDIPIHQGHCYSQKTVSRRFAREHKTRTYSDNRLPVVLNGGGGAPRQEANLYILSPLESDPQPSMSSHHFLADELEQQMRTIESGNIASIKLSQSSKIDISN